MQSYKAISDIIMSQINRASWQ